MGLGTQRHSLGIGFGIALQARYINGIGKFAISYRKGGESIESADMRSVPVDNLLPIYPSLLFCAAGEEEKAGQNQTE